MERKERKQVVDERVTTSELEILRSPPAVPIHSDLLPPLLLKHTQMIQHFTPSPSPPHLSPSRLTFLSFSLSLSLFFGGFFASCLSVSPAAPSLFLKIEPELTHYRESFVSTPTN